MSDVIRPALTSEEWASAHEPEDGPDWVDCQLSYSGDYSAYAHHEEAEHHRARLLALANHALSDGHPLKITREDVDTCVVAVTAIRQLMKRFEAELQSRPFFDPLAGLSSQWQDLERLGRKLDALLPPA